MSYYLSPIGNSNFVSSSGAPLSGGKVFTYQAGTTTLLATYTDNTGGTAQQNPITLNTLGLPPSPIWLLGAQAVKFVVKDALGNTVETVDSVSGVGDTRGAAFITGVAQVVSSIAALRQLLKSSASSKAFATGYYSDGDGGGGPYYYDASDTTSADNGGTIIVAADGGRWKLSNSGSVAVEQFGADGTGTNDSTTAIQNAINAVSVVYALNNYKINTTITLSGGKSLIGRPSKSNFTCAAGSYYSFSITGSDCVLRNLNMLASAKTGSNEVVINCGTNTINRTIIENVYTNGATGFITDVGSGANGFHISTFISNCQALTHRGPGLAFSRAFAFQYYEKVTVDYSQVAGAGNANFTGFSLSGSGLPANAGGCILRDCDVLGTSGTYANASQIGYSFSSCSEVWMNRCDADTCDGKGYVFNTVDKLHLDDVTASLCNNTGIEMTAVTNCKGSAIRVNGRQGLGVAAASVSGIAFVSGCGGVQLSNVLTRSCTGSGVQKVAAQAGSININGLSSIGNAGYGLQSTGNSAFLVVGATFAANTTGNYNLAGTLDYLQVSQLNSGAVVSVGPGPVSA